MKKKLCSQFILAGLLVGSTAYADIAVDHFENSGNVDTWSSAIVGGGTATIRDLTGVGGNLESNQPSPQNGAARLTTDSSTASKAEATTIADYGLASSVLSSVSLSYDYYKNVNAEHFAAPSIKLTIYNPAGTGDNYGTLIYEPNWNQGVNGSAAVPSGDWQTVSINQDTGAGDDAGQGWWWNGGFEIANGAGGPPIKSLSEWLTAFQTSDPTDFADAHVVALTVGVGSYNVDQDDYFDKVSIKTGNIDKTYDFQTRPSSVPDAGSSCMMLGMAFAGLVGLRRKFKA